MEEFHAAAIFRENNMVLLLSPPKNSNCGSKLENRFMHPRFLEKPTLDSSGDRTEKASDWNKEKSQQSQTEENNISEN
jgi:hypothetical protein